MLFLLFLFKNIALGFFVLGVVRFTCTEIVIRFLLVQKLEAAGFEGFITAAEKEPQPTPPGTKSVDELAQEVIDGKHGSGDARRESLGEQYEAVQQRVNELLK